MDRGHELTDEMLEKLEKDIAKEYRKAVRETREKLREYLQETESKRVIQEQLLKAGKITEKEYSDWCYRHSMVGKRWEAMKKTLARDLEHANEIALNMTKDRMPDVYALNGNYATFQIEQSGRIDTSFTLYNHDTAEYLLGDQRQLMPKPSAGKAAMIAANKDMQWNMKKIQSAVLQGVLQGESPYDVAKRLMRVGQMNYNSAVRYARTMTTSAQNAGRYEAYRRAKRLGVDLTIEWQSTLDGRTRHDHRLMHGQRTEVDEPFITPDGFTIYYPADCTGESDAPQKEIWNCRCTLLSWVKGFEGETVKYSEKMEGKSFEEWQEEHKPTPKPTPAPTPAPAVEPKSVADNVINIDSDKIGKPAFKEDELTESISSSVKDYANNVGIKYNSVTFDTQRTKDEIIAYLGGGDLTQGSCSSLAFAYFGNGSGYRCIDYRGGESRAFFSKNKNILSITNIPNVKSYIDKNLSDFNAVGKLLTNVVEGKEYYLATGRHAAVIRKVSGHYEYLELQSANKNGWFTLDNDSLKRRFACKRSHSFHGMKYECTSELIDGDSLKNNTEFLKILGYINTDEASQLKGVLGSVK